MKRLCLLILTAILLMVCESAFAAKARSISSDSDSAYHAEHLIKHLDETECQATGNYIKTRSKANGSKVVGHLEQADEFILLDVKNGWAQIEVVYSDKTSPDSWEGMTGWVNSDYIDCVCSTNKYYAYSEHSPQGNWDGHSKTLLYFYNAIIEEWDYQKIVDSGFCEPYYFPNSLEDYGFVLRDLNSDGIKELIILHKDYFTSNGDIFITAIYTLKNGISTRILESWTRNRHYILHDGSVFNEGSNGASYAVQYILDLIDSEFIVREGVLSGDYYENGETKYGWFLVDEEADFSYMDHKRISDEKAHQRISEYKKLIDYQLGDFISFKQFENTLE